MADYRPETALERLLSVAIRMPGGIGRSAGRKLRRRYVHRAVRHFEAFCARLCPGDVCLDLGANVGSVTKLLAASGATVHAFEPDPETFGALERNVGTIGNVVLHPCGVAAHPARVALYRRKREPGVTWASRSTGSTLIHDPSRIELGEEVEVEVIGLREFLSDLGKPVSIIKMDIEGAEIDILFDPFANPAAYPAAAVYVETHERQMPRQLPDVLRLRALAAKIATPDVHLYWH
ncbi:MAG: FkbM family methyltransferase [Rhodobacteraceae bacterium]|jgi:FkbM family methyltransferase|nr:FkbM family methyltransferase [Paracoccaceae bacterium]